ncbi:methyltransferase domain protein [Leptospira kirschneri serovar Bulgarica str. Nikolaevo]|uniref:Methyltransferase domain protein n=1 Tax=Leptospira kirschneri serovar Bulgarica str. Nikolaevo TaxID=1240687 RepID=M6FS63_9LEPT|nr:methyltransferase domain protein [Leptospira kirschneri serovar Bulgarica str. Nikolaevo]
MKSQKKHRKDLIRVRQTHRKKSDFFK